MVTTTIIMVPKVLNNIKRSQKVLKNAFGPGITDIHHGFSHMLRAYGQKNPCNIMSSLSWSSLATAADSKATLFKAS